MNGEPFTLDTNILIYSVDTGERHRHALARAIRDQAVDCNCRLTLQAVSEFFAVVTRKNMLARQEAAQAADKLLTVFPTATGSASAIRAALALSVSGRASYWDALMIATAAEAGCSAIITEDFADGISLLGVRIVHPFDGPKLTSPARNILGL